jgi:hypothetical protein
VETLDSAQKDREAHLVDMLSSLTTGQQDLGHLVQGLANRA